MGPAQRFTPLAVTDAAVLFRSKLAANFGNTDWLPAADGSIHRFHVLGDKLNLSESAVLNDHCCPLWEAGKEQTDHAVAKLLGHTSPSQQ